VLDGLRVKPKKAEVVDWIAIDGVRFGLLVVVKDTVATERAGPNDVTVCEDISVGRNFCLVVY
jgi:hypothetical protein